MRDKIVFIQGRPKTHPMHEAFAKSVNADFIFADHILRWLDNPKASILRKIASVLMSAFFFPHKKDYNIFFVDSIRHSVWLMKKLRIIKSNQELVLFIDDETTYFYLTKRYNYFSRFFVRSMINCADRIITVGNYQRSLISKINSNKNIDVVFNGVLTFRFNNLLRLKPTLKSNKILCIANGPGEQRAFYKGIDILIESFCLVYSKYSNLFMQVIGDWDSEYLAKIKLEYNLSNYPITFTGLSNDIEGELNYALLYLHCARGDSWGISVVEAMLAGVVPIVSNQTGSKEVVEIVDKNLVSSLDVHEISEKIEWFINLSYPQKLALSSKCKKVAQSYSEEKVIKQFISVFNKSA